MDEDNSTLGRLERLWAPWRMEYIRAARDNGCILCAFPAQSDDESHLILHRGQHNFIMMNAYPYSPGHLMVAPFKHTAELADLTAAESAEHLELVKPRSFMTEETKRMACNAFDILAKAKTYGNLDEALQTKTLVVGTTRRLGRTRGLILPLEEGIKKVIASAKKNRVAILFGREDKGLNNREIEGRGRGI